MTQFQTGDSVLVTLDRRSIIAKVGERHATRWVQPTDGSDDLRPTQGDLLPPADALGRYWLDVEDGATYSNGKLLPPRRVMFHGSEMMRVPS